ncbi:MAG TPA: Plug domain-containing protein, partial [Gemmatimonadaceae bacterium]|nr:Plug domain-containing protein [Gemmatimonadaceae bacterium]
KFVALGFSPKQYELKRAADEDILVADARLSTAANVLDEVRITAPRDKASRNDVQPDIGGTEKTINNTNLSADQLGDLAAMAASIPGINYVAGTNGDPSGFSVLGLTPDQNSSTLNGMNSNAGNLPRDAQTISTVVTSPYDVTRGGFSGGQQNTRLRSGSNFINQGSSLLMQVPPLEFTSAAARSLGQEYTQLNLGGQTSGPISIDKAFYNFSYSLGQTSNPLASLLNADSIGFVTAGIAPDSVTRLLNILKAQRIPLSAGGIGSQKLSDNGGISGTIDFAPPGSKTGDAYNLTMTGNWSKLSPFSSPGTSELPAHSGDRTSWGGALQFHHSTYFGFGILSESGVSVNASRNYVSPFLALPNATVLVSSAFPDGSNVSKNVSFGGSTQQNTSTYSTSVDFTNMLSWFSENNKHRLKLATEVRRDDYSLNQTTNTLGSFYYNSLADIAAGTPSLYTRTLSPIRVSGGQYIEGLALMDSYKAGSTVQIQYGVRADANQYVNEANANPLVQQLYGTPNNYQPEHIFVSPRVGFSWAYGTAPQVSGFAGAFRGPRAVLSGGVGVFQSYPSSTLLSGTMTNTGLANAVQQITCAGSAVPMPNWSGYETNPSTIPTTCANGATPTPFASSAPNVLLAAKDYTSPRSVRGNLTWRGAILDNLFNANFTGTYSLNLNQPESVDLNFNPTQRFALAGEGNRPVFVNPTSIDPNTGVIASGDGRVSSSFNRVTQLRTDLTSNTKQFQVQLSPTTFNSKLTWNLAYTYQELRSQSRGFSSTVGNPFDLQWARGQGDWRHQIQYTLGYNFFNTVRVSWTGRLQSGTPFTPVIQGDVNGDGYSNDRAFIYNPATTADPTLAASMQQLLNGASDKVRSCLQKQLGALAGLNSCEGPWTTSASMNITFNPLKLHLPQRATFSLSINNPLGAADLALHGENHLQGWGQTPFIDNNLMYVRGFDQTKNQYTYAVNQRFGSSSTAFNTLLQPVSIVALLRFDTAPTRERQTLTQSLDRGRTTEGTRIQEPILKALYGTNSVFNPLPQILRQADTLHLTGDQADSIATLNRWYTIRVDSIWSPVTKELAALPKKYDHDAAYDRYRAAREATVDLLLKVSPGVKGLLTAEQRRKLPDIVTTSLDPWYLQSIRSGTAGSGGNPFSNTAAALGGGGPVTIRF